MEIKKTAVSAKPQGMTLTDGTHLSARERLDIKTLFKQKKWSQKALCAHYDIKHSDMNKIVGSTAEVFGQRQK